MKKFVLILITLILILTFSACDQNYSPTDDQTDQQNNQQNDQQENQQNNQQTKKLTITHKIQTNEIYTEYKLGNYYGNGLEDSFDVGVAEYKIIKDYNEAKNVTDYGASLNKSVFLDHYILAIRCLYNHDFAGIIGFKEITIENGQPEITVIQNGSENVYTKEFYYIAIPKYEIENWSTTGRLTINKETCAYKQAIQVLTDTSLEKQDATINLMSREEMIEYINLKSLPIDIDSLEITQSYLTCFSKEKFDTIPSFSYPTISSDTITVSRYCNLSSEKEKSAYFTIIPLNFINVENIKRLDINTHILEKGTLISKDYQINNTTITYDYAKFYKTFKGGVYYGTELADKNTSSYTIIESYRELLDKAEFYINEEIFDRNYVLVLKVINKSQYHLGYANAQVTSYGIRLEEYLSSYSLREEEVTEIEDGIVDVLEPITIDYEYIVIPKERLYGISKKTGTLSFDINRTFLDNEDVTIEKKSFDAKNFNIKSGDTWHITNKLEMQAFNEKFGTNYSDKYLISPYNNEYIIIYIEDSNQYINHKTVISENENILKLCYLVEKREQAKEQSGYFIRITRDFDETQELFVNIEYTIIEYGSYESYNTNKSINTYDFYKMQLYSDNKPEWKHKLIDNYNQLEEIFNTYKSDKYTNDTLDRIFNINIFDENYILALQIDENHSGARKNTFYNARIGGDKVLYLYAYNNSNGGDQMICQMLYFIVIPQKEINCEISNVCVELTKEVVCNGPFESVSIGSKNEADVTLDKEYLIINSYLELAEILEDYNTYKKLQDIDFENYFVLAFNRQPYYTAEYKYCDFINFKTTLNGTATITVMSPDEKWLTDYTKNYVLDLVIIPKEYLKYRIDYFYVRYTKSEEYKMEELEDISML